MPTHIAILLLTIFAIHFVIFLRLYVKRRHPPHILVCLTFLFLFISIILRHWFAPLAVGPVPVYWLPRVVAWGTTAAFLFYKFRRS